MLYSCTHIATVGVKALKQKRISYKVSCVYYRADCTDATPMCGVGRCYTVLLPDRLHVVLWTAVCISHLPHTVRNGLHDRLLGLRTQLRTCSIIFFQPCMALAATCRLRYDLRPPHSKKCQPLSTLWFCSPLLARQVAANFLLLERQL